MESRSSTSKTFSSVSILPGQAMASIEELKSELLINNDNQPLQISIRSSLISKLEPEDQISYIKQKIHLLIEAYCLQEAQIDIQSLLLLENNEENRLIYCKILSLNQDYLNCMTQLLKLKNVNTDTVFEKNVEDLLESDFFDTLYVIPNLPDLYSSQITFFPELRGKVVLQISSSAYQTYILISTCPHLAYKAPCPQGLYHCSEDLQLLEVSNNILVPIDFLCNQKLAMVSCSDNISGVLHRPGRITLWGDLPEGKNHLILETQCQEIVVGGTFVCMITDNSLFFWGKVGEVNSMTTNYSNIIKLANMTGSVSCSDNHILLLNNEKVYSIGIGEEGQLGLGEIVSVLEFQNTEIELPVTQILCNNEVSVAITYEAIYVWGLINPLQLNGSPRNF